MAHIALGIALRQSSRKAEAVEAFKHALELSPEGSAMREELGAELARYEAEGAAPASEAP